MYLCFEFSDSFVFVFNIVLFTKRKTSNIALFTKSSFTLARALQNCDRNHGHFWFPRFQSWNFDQRNKPCGWPGTLVDYEELKVIAEVNPKQTTSKVSADFGMTDTTILIHLKQPGKEKKLENGYRMNRLKAHQQTRIKCCVTLFLRQNSEGFKKNRQSNSLNGIKYIN